eukprot:SAG31_NODE_2105_length_6432_cov_22.218696_3_plen_162_part_00
MLKVYAKNPKKLAEQMSSVRSNFLRLEQAVQFILDLYPCDLEDVGKQTEEELLKRSKCGKDETRIIPIDEFLDHAVEIWCQMAEGQRVLLLQLFEKHDDGDGSYHHFLWLHHYQHCRLSWPGFVRRSAFLGRIFKYHQGNRTERRRASNHGVVQAMLNENC